MPTYEYLCANCGNAWEEIQKITEPALDVCPKCQQATAKRQISGGNFILKGGGWYADLYSSPKSGSKTEASAKPDSGGGTSGGGESKGGGGETKTEAKSEAKKESTAAASSAGSGTGSTGPAKAAAQ
jgi:putative FmdB family regulatory protein